MHTQPAPAKVANATRVVADPAINDLAVRAQALAEKGINYCAHTGERLREQVDGCTQATTRYVAQQPGKSMLIAAAMGAAVATVAMVVARRRACA